MLGTNADVALNYQENRRLVDAGRIIVGFDASRDEWRGLSVANDWLNRYEMLTGLPPFFDGKPAIPSLRVFGSPYLLV